MVLLVVLSIYELGRLFESGGNSPVTHWAAFVGAGLAIVPWVQMQQEMGSSGTLVQTDLSLTVLWLTGGLLGTCLAVLLRKRADGAMGSMALTMFMVIYLGLLSSFAVRVRCLSPGPVGAGLLVFYILTVNVHILSFVQLLIFFIRRCTQRMVSINSIMRVMPIQ